MRARINGGGPRELDDKVAYCLTLDAATRVSGRIRDANAVARVHLWRSIREGWFLWEAGLVAFLVIVALFGAPSPKQWEISLLIAATIATVIEAAVRIALGAKWRRGIDQYLATLPPPGTLIQVGDESGLTIGATHTPWDALCLEDVSLRKFSIPTNFYRTRYRVDRMRLATLGGLVDLDPIAIEHGQTIVDTIWRRLQR